MSDAKIEIVRVDADGAVVEVLHDDFPEGWGAARSEFGKVRHSDAGKEAAGAGHFLELRVNGETKMSTAKKDARKKRPAPKSDGGAKKSRKTEPTPADKAGASGKKRDLDGAPKAPTEAPKPAVAGGRDVERVAPREGKNAPVVKRLFDFAEDPNCGYVQWNHQGTGVVIDKQLYNDAAANFKTYKTFAALSGSLAHYGFTSKGGNAKATTTSVLTHPNCRRGGAAELYKITYKITAKKASPPKLVLPAPGKPLSIVCTAAYCKHKRVPRPALEFVPRQGRDLDRLRADYATWVDIAQDPAYDNERRLKALGKVLEMQASRCDGCALERQRVHAAFKATEQPPRDVTIYGRRETIVSPSGEPAWKLDSKKPVPDFAYPNTRRYANGLPIQQRTAKREDSASRHELGCSCGIFAGARYLLAAGADSSLPVRCYLIETDGGPTPEIAGPHVAFKKQAQFLGTGNGGGANPETEEYEIAHGLATEKCYFCHKTSTYGPIPPFTGK